MYHYCLYDDDGMLLYFQLMKSRMNLIYQSRPDVYRAIIVCIMTRDNAAVFSADEELYEPD